jgi:hypothetical protein
MDTPENVNLHGYTFGVYSYPFLRMPVDYKLGVRNYINESTPFPPRNRIGLIKTNNTIHTL